MKFDKDYWRIAYNDFCMDYPNLSRDRFSWYPTGQNEINISVRGVRGYETYVYDNFHKALYIIDDNRNDIYNEDEFNIRFRNELRNQMFVNRLNQRELASVIGVTPVMLNRYLSGKATPNAYIVYRMTRVFNCSMNELIFPKKPCEEGSGRGLRSDEERKRYWKMGFEEFLYWYPQYVDKVIEWYPIKQCLILIKTKDGLYHKYDWIYRTSYNNIVDPNIDICEYNTKEEWGARFCKTFYTRLIEPGGLSQDMISYRTGISPSTMSYYSTGDRIPSIYNLYRILCAIKCSANEVLP